VQNHTNHSALGPLILFKDTRKLIRFIERPKQEGSPKRYQEAQDQQVPVSQGCTLSSFSLNPRMFKEGAIDGTLIFFVQVDPKFRRNAKFAMQGTEKALRESRKSKVQVRAFSKVPSCLSCLANIVVPSVMRQSP
jgi:hypothetical protein